MSVMEMVESGYSLSDEQITAYRKDGFIVLHDVFAGAELAELRDAVAAAVAGEMHLGVMAEEKGKLDTSKSGLEEGQAAAQKEAAATKGAYEQLFIQKVNLWRRWPAVAKFVTSTRVGNIAARLEGSPMRVWHDQALFKEPKTGVKTPWHRMRSIGRMPSAAARRRSGLRSRMRLFGTAA